MAQDEGNAPEGAGARWFDLPPLWLAGFLVLAWIIRKILPGLVLDAAILDWFGAALALAGLVLMLLAIVEMSRARTTVVPHRQPDKLVATGPFRISRNPIYLGDALILVGAILWWGAVAALPLVVLFVRVIEKRFIRPEEARLRAGFGAEFDDWAAKTRRWM